MVKISADIAEHKCGHRYKIYAKVCSNNGVLGNLGCDQDKFQFFRKIINQKLLFATVDNHRSIGVVEQVIQTLKHS